MKRTAARILWIAFVITLISYAVIGLKLLDGNYEFTVEAYIGAVGFFTMLLCILIRAFGNRCPHCGRVTSDNGRFCSHCGKQIKE